MVSLSDAEAVPQNGQTMAQFSAASDPMPRVDRYKSSSIPRLYRHNDIYSGSTAKELAAF